MQLIDEVEDLLTMDEDQLLDVLIQDQYNKPNLRELIRRILKKTKEYKQAFEYEKDKHEAYLDSVENTASALLRINNHHND